MHIYEMTIGRFEEKILGKIPKGNISIANTPMYLKYCKNISNKAVYLVAIEQEEIVGIWALIKHITLIVTHSFPDLVIFDGHQETNWADVMRAMILFLREKYTGKRLCIDNYTLARNENKEILDELHFENVKEYVAYTNPIGSIEDNIMRFHPSHRNDTRKAIKEGYLYKDSISLAEYYELSKETYSRSDLKGISKERLKKLKKEFGKNAIISGVYYQNKLVAASIILYYEDVGVYFLGASADNKPRGATAYLQYMNMDILQNRSVVYYDFGGACLVGNDEKALEKARSICSFKRRFGGAESIHFLGQLVL